MDITVVSERDCILHIMNYGYLAKYSIYDKTGSYLGGGFFESASGLFDDEKLTKEVVNFVNECVLNFIPKEYICNSETVSLEKIYNCIDSFNNSINEPFYYIRGENVYM